MSSSRGVSQRSSYGQCARSGCQMTNVLGIPRHQESKTCSKLGRYGLTMQKACSAGCHDLLENARYKVHRNVPFELRRQSVQSPCQQCHEMVSTGSRNILNGSYVRALKPLCTRGTFCEECWKTKMGDVLLFPCTVLIIGRHICGHRCSC